MRLILLFMLLLAGCGDSHSCRTYTQWEVKFGVVTGSYGGETNPTARRCWNERSCVECGKTFQEPLNYLADKDTGRK